MIVVGHREYELLQQIRIAAEIVVGCSLPFARGGYRVPECSIEDLRALLTRANQRFFDPYVANARERNEASINDSRRPHDGVSAY